MGFQNINNFYSRIKIWDAFDVSSGQTRFSNIFVSSLESLRKYKNNVFSLMKNGCFVHRTKLCFQASNKITLFRSLFVAIFNAIVATIICYVCFTTTAFHNVESLKSEKTKNSFKQKKKLVSFFSLWLCFAFKNLVVCSFQYCIRTHARTKRHIQKNEKAWEIDKFQNSSFSD